MNLSLATVAQYFSNMESCEKKASYVQQTRSLSRNKVGKHTVTGKRRKIKQAEQNQCPIAALKDNNRQLASALDGLRQDYRKLQQDNLQLKQERQHLLEKVARLEKKASKHSLSELLREAQCNLREVQSALDCVLKSVRSSPSSKQQSLCLTNKQSSLRSKKILRFSTPSQSDGCTIYPRTPYPLHNMTCVVDGPQLASTPVKSAGLTGSSQSMHLAPQKISYSDDASSTKESASVADKEKNESQLDQSDVISPIEEVHKEENPAISHNSTLDHLEDALTSDSRPRRKCTSLSLSYQEPSLHRKLRRGDPFTEHVAGWDPPDCNERKKRVAKKNKTIDKRKVLQDVQNQL